MLYNSHAAPPRGQKSSKYKYATKGVSELCGNESHESGKAGKETQNVSKKVTIGVKLASPYIRLDNQQFLCFGLDFLGFRNQQRMCQLH
jgi:hypothetical protein